MSIVRLNKEQLWETFSLSEYAFQYKIKQEEHNERLQNLEQHDVYGIFDQGRLAAKLHIIPFEIYLGQMKLKMGGIAGVATYPEYRRKGYAKELLLYSLQVMRDAGTSLSMLNPFSFPFYRKLGWEACSDRMTCQFTHHELIPFQHEPSGVVRRFYKETHSPDIEDVYEAWSFRHAGMLVRDRKWWLDLYDNHTAAVYYDEHSQPQGYMLYTMNNSVMQVREFMCITPESRIGLWNYICQHDSMAKQVEMRLSQDERLLFALDNPRIPRTLHPNFMARIVDVASFLEHYQFAPVSLHQPIILSIRDVHAPWNNISILLQEGHATLLSPNDSQNNPLLSTINNISVNIRSLTALLLGYQRPLELYECGILTGDFSSIQVLEQLIPRLRPYISDSF